MNAGTIVVIQGQQPTLDLTFTNSDGSAFNLTDCSIALAVSYTSSDASTPVISKNATITNASGGLASIALTTEDTEIATRLWWYQITLTDSGNVAHPSGYFPWVVSETGNATTSMGVTINSGAVSIGIEMAGAQGAPGEGVPTGGTSGQVLTKNSSTNYDASWETPASGAVTNVFGRTGVVTAQSGDYTAAQVGADASGAAATAQSNAEAFATSAVATETTRAEAAEALLAPLASPALTGTPTAPTPTTGDNSTKLATTAFVEGALPTTLPPSGSAGGDLTGSYPNPTLANTANVQAIIAADAPVASVAGRTGIVVITSSDVGLGNVANSLQLVAANNLSDLVSPSTARTNLGLGTLATLNSIDLTANVGSTVLPIANGGTGSATQNFVDLTTVQTIGGNKSFSGTITFQNTSSAYFKNIQFITNNTYNIGSTTAYAQYIYASRHYFNSTANIDGGTAGQITLTTNGGSGGGGGLILNDTGPSSGSSDYEATHFTVSDSGTYTGALYGMYVKPTGNVTTKWVVGGKFNPVFTSTGGLGKLSAFYCVPETNSSFTSGTITQMFGFESQPYVDASGGTISTLAHAFFDGLGGAGAPTITNLYGIYMNNAGKTVGTQYGIYVSSLTSGSTNYALYTNAGPNHFGDMVDILGTSATATHSLTLGSTATGIALYNTSDQTTNYERAKFYWSGNVFNILAEAGGTGLTRNITITAVGSSVFSVGSSLGSGSSSFLMQRSSTNNDLVEISSTGLTKSSGTQYALRINPTINQSSTAGYTALLVNPTETTTGSGTNLLADFQVGGSSKVSIDDTGILYTKSLSVSGNIGFGANSTYNVGSTGAYAANLFATTLNLNSTASISGSTAGNLIVTGTIQLSVTKIFGATSFNDGINIALGTTTGTQIGTSTSQKLGLWAATPIVQPTTGVASSTLVANSGTALNSASTFDGYTLAQVVKALRNIGLLA